VCKVMVFCCKWCGKLGIWAKLSCCTKMLEATTKTKRGNFGSLPRTNTMLGPTPLYYYMCGLGIGPWVWKVWIHPPRILCYQL
jgi:hypothetical protein